MKWKHLLTLLLVFLLFSSCGKETKQAEEPGSTTERGTELDAAFGQIDNTTAVVQTTILSTEPQSATPLPTLPDTTAEVTQSLEELMKSVENVQTVGSAMFTDLTNTDLFELPDYNGADLEFYYQMGAGIEAVDYGVGFTLNGVYQFFQLERNGVTTDFATRHIVHIDPQTAPVYKVRLRPSIGKAGEVVKFQNATILDPEARVTKEKDWYRQSDIQLMTTFPSEITMLQDAPTQTEINTSFSGATVGEYIPVFRDWVYISNKTDEYCRSLVCYSLEDEVYYSDRDGSLMSVSRIEVPRNPQLPMTILLGGGEATRQRVSLYVNGQQMPVFDGKYYADVPVEKGKQTTLTVYLDTSTMEEWNNIFVITYGLDVKEGFEGMNLNQSERYVLRVQ